MRVVHITPTYFDESSIIGGGERYPSELAAWMARKVPTTLVSFWRSRRSLKQGQLQMEFFPVRHLLQGNKINPLSFRFLSKIRGADVIHIHHVHTFTSDLACLVGSLCGKKTFVTDYGGGGGRVLNTRLPVLPRYTGAIAYSQFGLAMLPEVLRHKARLIKGGIDTERFRPDLSVAKKNYILYVGRILPHKGVNDLIEAFRIFAKPAYRLRIIGRAYDQRFYNDLQVMAKGLAVDFIHDATDQMLINEYQMAKVTVLPSVHRDMYGNYSPVPELMGFTLLESQACGTPVVCTDAGAMSEFIAPSSTGHVVLQNSPSGIAKALEEIITRTGENYYTANCRTFAEELDWASVVKQHLELYANQFKLMNSGKQ